MKKKHIILKILCLGILTMKCSFKEQNIEESKKPRLIITTDIGGDPDDQQSLVRLLLYSNEFDIEALIATSSGVIGELEKDTVKVQLIKDYVAAYQQVYPSLKKHSANFPDPEYLKSIIKSGNPHRGIENIGSEKDTEATDFIIEIIDREDDRKVNICIWGGQTDVIQAIWKVKNTRSHKEYLEFISKLRIYDIFDQDLIYPYIKNEFPELFYILSKAPEGVDKREGVYRGMYLGGNEGLTSRKWIDTNIRIGHGPLGAIYPDATWTRPNPHKGVKEGDTPSWFYFLKNGLQDAEYPSWGGWGGRYTRDTLQFFKDTTDFADGETNARATVFRWREYYQNEFSARMDWCVESRDNANHSPFIVVNGKKCLEPIIIEVSEGNNVVLSAAGSTDPDGDELEFYWWIYPEAGTHHVCPKMDNYLSSEVTLTVPEGEKGNEFHLVCQISDNGNPKLTSFKRIVLRVI